MSTSAGSDDSVATIEARLTSQAKRLDFDMIDDDLDRESLKSVQPLHDALTWLHYHLTPEWVAADGLAIKHQRRHQWLARTAVLTGVGAIVFAVLQLALKLSSPDSVELAARTEILVVLVCVGAVIAGLRAKSDRKWLGWRHRAERLRMLKFRSLAEPTLWSATQDAWRTWTTRELAAIPNPERHRRQEAKERQQEELERWSNEDTAETPTTAEAQEFNVDAVSSRALAVYYRHKRLLNQGEYFERKGKEAGSKWAVKLRDRRELLFFVPIGSVAVHFLADLIEPWSTPAQHRVLEAISLWGLVLAAVLPVVGLGIRAWSAAFELSRKARSFAAKHQAMTNAAERLGRGEDQLPILLGHMRHNELFLEQEHREWLRLLLDAEWFL